MPWIKKTINWPDDSGAAVQQGSLRLYFSPDSIDLSNAAKRKLDAAVVALRESADAQLMIVGFSNNHGVQSQGDLTALSRSRAVYRYLASHGAELRRVRVLWHASPLDVAEEKHGAAKFRKVEMYFVRFPYRRDAASP